MCSPPDPQKKDPADPGCSKVRDFLLYGLSLPERALRSASGLVGGTLRESASLLVPQAFRNSKTYSIMIQQMLDFLAEDVGGVARAAAAGADQTKDFVARKAVGNFIDMASMATLHLSPMLLLAIVGDMAYGSQVYLHELAVDLKRRGVLDERSTIDNVDDLLAAVAGAAATTAGTLNAPPISVEGLKRTIDDTRSAIARIDPTQVVPKAEIERLWDEIHRIAAEEGLNPVAVSGVITLHALGAIGSVGRGALSTATAAGTLLDRHVLEHYASAIREIRSRGVYASLQATSRPYVEAVWKNFSVKKTTLTEDLFSGRLLARACGALRRWLGRKTPPQAV
jgi:hypothetical protein